MLYLYFRWCKLEGILLKFWNYPQDTGSSVEPIETIDLSRCEQDQVDEADRTLCPRPRTIVIKINDPTSFAMDKSRLYFLVTDNKLELRLWMKELNKVLRFIKDWNIN